MATQTLDQLIEKTPGTLGGKPRISGRRISVQDIVVWHEWMGRGVDEIASEFDLTLAEIYAALAHYYSHREEVDRSIAESEAFVSKMRMQSISKVAVKLNEPANSILR